MMHLGHDMSALGSDLEDDLSWQRSPIGESQIRRMTWEGVQGSWKQDLLPALSDLQ